MDIGLVKQLREDIFTPVTKKEGKVRNAAYLATPEGQLRAQTDAVEKKVYKLLTQIETILEQLPPDADQSVFEVIVDWANGL